MGKNQHVTPHPGVCYCLKNSRGLHPKAPFKICAVRFTLARGVCNSLNLEIIAKKMTVSIDTKHAVYSNGEEQDSQVPITFFAALLTLIR